MLACWEVVCACKLGGSGHLNTPCSTTLQRLLQQSATQEGHLTRHLGWGSE